MFNKLINVTMETILADFAAILNKAKKAKVEHKVKAGKIAEQIETLKETRMYHVEAVSDLDSVIKALNTLVKKL